MIIQYQAVSIKETIWFCIFIFSVLILFRITGFACKKANIVGVFIINNHKVQLCLIRSPEISCSAWDRIFFFFRVLSKIIGGSGQPVCLAQRRLDKSWIEALFWKFCMQTIKEKKIVEKLVINLEQCNIDDCDLYPQF